MLFEVTYTKPSGRDVKRNKHGTFRNNKQLLNWTMVRYGTIATNKKTGEMEKIRWLVFAAQKLSFIDHATVFFGLRSLFQANLSKKIILFCLLIITFNHGPVSDNNCPMTLSTGLVHITGLVTQESVRTMVL